MLIESAENKNKILTEFLKICVFEGWNDDSLKKAIINSGFEEKFTGIIFEKGCIDIADFFISQTNQKMLKKLKELDLDKMRVRDKIAKAVIINLEINNENKAALKKLVNFYSHPKRVVYAFKSCYKVVDLIWYEIGDKSTDFNFYTKRAILSKVYIRTLKYFIDDNSENNNKTLDFLDRQVERVMKFAAFKAQAKGFCNKISNLKESFKGKSPKELIKKLPFFRLIK